jgi:F-type H+-transporting ATPase subunit b
VLTAVVTLAGDSLVSVRLHAVTSEPPTTEAAADEQSTEGTAVEGAAAEESEASHDAETATEEHTEELDEGPSPIMPEVKEMAWGFGAFVVLALAMRFFLFPRLRKGMTARYDSIQQGFTDADALRANAKGAVADYESSLASLRAEAAGRVEAARQVLETERQAMLAEVNARIAERRSAAAAETEAARAAAAGQVNEAAGSVAARVVELVTGSRPNDDAVRSAVESVTATSSSAGVR